MDLTQEATELKWRVHVAVTHAADTHAHQLTRQVGHAQQVVCGGYLEGQHCWILPQGHDLVTLMNTKRHTFSQPFLKTNTLASELLSYSEGMKGITKIAQKYSKKTERSGMWK